MICYFFIVSIQKIIIIYIKKPFTICPKPNKHNILISREGLLRINKELLKNPFINCKFIKDKLSGTPSECQFLFKKIKTSKLSLNIL